MHRFVPKSLLFGLALPLLMFGAVHLALLSSNDAPAEQSLTGLTGTSQESSMHYTPTPCNRPTKRERVAQCFSVVWTPNESHSIRAHAEGPPASALSPADVQDAYNLPEGGAGQTVAIVDAFGYSTAEADLAAFREQYGLPPCTTENGCFTKVDQRGGTDYPPNNRGWALETALDLDAVSAVCPQCKILLVEGDSAAVGDLADAVETAVDLGADYVSNSYGVNGGFEQQRDFDPSYNQPGVAVVVSAGDTGGVKSWPSTNPHVTAVGGTTLTEDDSQRGWHESVWGSPNGGDGTGSGCALREPKPTYQNAIDTHCEKRATADIAAVADPATGLAVYDTLGYDGWLQVGGTSLSAPLVAGMYALAGTPSADTYPVTYPYHDQNQDVHLFDVTEGANSGCGTVLCEAGPGWDGPTGLGTPNGVVALASGPHGEIAGTVTDADTGKPVGEATVTTEPGGYRILTDDEGNYTFSGVATGSYQVIAEKYGYGAETVDGVDVVAGQTTTVDIALESVSTGTVSGVVTDDSRDGRPLYATITIDGYPDNPVFTNPVTGAYTVELAIGNYDVKVESVYDGFLVSTGTLTVGAENTERNWSLAPDRKKCIAPGFGWNGALTTFTGWDAHTLTEGWTVTGRHGQWRFDNPENRQQPIGGEGRFAVADPAAHHPKRPITTTVTSPPIDVSEQNSPHLSLDMRYVGERHQSGTIEYSINGRTWTPLWSATTELVTGHRTFPLQTDVASVVSRSMSTVRIRFTFRGRAPGYWALDNIFVGTRDCVAQPGGMLVGDVTDAATSDPLPGARVHVAGLPGSTVSSHKIPNDQARTGAIYWMFLPKGDQELTVTARDYTTHQMTVTVRERSVVRSDVALTPTGQ